MKNMFLPNEPIFQTAISDRIKPNQTKSNQMNNKRLIGGFCMQIVASSISASDCD
jgi:hypothetical protein